MKKPFITSKYITIILFSLFLLMAISPTIVAEEENPGGKVAFIVKDKVLPQVKANEWTDINITVYDQYDFNWTLLDAQFSDFTMFVMWPIMFGDLQFARYLGYTTIEFEADVIDQNGNKAEGWSAQIEPSVIFDTTQGHVHDVKIRAQTHRLEVDYSVRARIKVTRKDTWGEVEGWNYLYIPLKAASLNEIEMKSQESTRKTSPFSTTKFKLDVTNKGYYEDIFRFNIVGENGVKGLIDAQGLDLKPGETKTITLQVMTPDKFFDAGTSNKMDIYCYSRLNQTHTYIGSVTVITEGFYLSQLSIIIIGIIIIAIALLILLITKLNSKDSKKEDKEEKTKEKTRLKIFKKSKKEEKIEPFQPIDEELQEFKEVKKPQKKQKRK